MSLKFDFEGKVVLVTGSSSGIGAQTSIQFAEFGANVVVTGRNADNVKRVAEKCLQVSHNSKILEVVADLTNEEEVQRLIDETIKTFGKLDILVNNAGAAFITSITDEDYMHKYRQTLETNLNSVVLLTHLSVKHLEKTKGNIINISSICALRSDDLVVPYKVAKAGLDMFTKCMAAELGVKGIRVNCINPGIISTPIFATMGCDQDTVANLEKGVAATIPVARMGTPEDIANAVLFLASDKSSFITGSSLVSDGGHLAVNASLKISSYQGDK